MITAALVNVIRVALIDLDAYAASGNVLDIPKVIPIIMAVILFFAMKKLKWHPVIFIGISALVGIILKL